MQTIRRFQKEDAPALSALIRRTLLEVNTDSPAAEVEYLYGRYTPETMMQLAQEGHTYVLEEDGVISGTGTVLPSGADEAEIAAAFLRPESIGKGCGRALFAALEEDPLVVSARRIWLTSSDMAQGFYERMGYVNPNGYRTRGGEDNLLYMEKRK